MGLLSPGVNSRAKLAASDLSIISAPEEGMEKRIRKIIPGSLEEGSVGVGLFHELTAYGHTNSKSRLEEILAFYLLI